MEPKPREMVQAGLLALVMLACVVLLVVAALPS
jgi:hypothetical protein